jgi:hypothetical protein
MSIIAGVRVISRCLVYCIFTVFESLMGAAFGRKGRYQLERGGDEHEQVMGGMAEEEGRKGRGEGREQHETREKGFGTRGGCEHQGFGLKVMRQRRGREGEGEMMMAHRQTATAGFAVADC